MRRLFSIKLNKTHTFCSVVSLAVLSSRSGSMALNSVIISRDIHVGLKKPCFQQHSALFITILPPLSSYFLWPVDSCLSLLHSPPHSNTAVLILMYFPKLHSWQEKDIQQQLSWCRSRPKCKDKYPKDPRSNNTNHNCLYVYKKAMWWSRMPVFGKQQTELNTVMMHVIDSIKSRIELMIKG